jgi:hypothetical protein
VSPIQDSINRIAAKQNELARLTLSANREAVVKAFVERAFAASALSLAGHAVSEEQIAGVQKALGQEPVSLSGLERKIQIALASISILRSAVDRGESLTPELLQRIRDPFPTAPSTDDPLNAATEAGANELERATVRVRAFCEWTAADSFRELNPLEQAAIIILRLLEIRPFAEGNVTAALAAGSLFTMRVGWQPIVVPAGLRPRFNQAVTEGMKMNTRPLVDLLAESLASTIDSILELATGTRG